MSGADDLLDKLARRVHRDFGHDACDAVLAALAEFVAERPEHLREALDAMGLEVTEAWFDPVYKIAWPGQSMGDLSPPNCLVVCPRGEER